MKGKLNVIQKHTEMNKMLCLGLLGLVIALAGVRAEEEMGTVIGIDLGTTYSWYVSPLSER